MKPILVFILFMPFFCAGESAHIASWNLDGNNPISINRLNNISTGLKILKADIVVLSNVNTFSRGKWLATSLSYDLDPCHKAITPEQPRTDQAISFLMKCEVEVLSSGMIMGSDLGKQGYRNAAFIHARINEFDFMLIGVHLKEGRSDEAKAERKEQLERIGIFAQSAIAMGERDILIVGDYNLDYETERESLDVLKAQGLSFIFPSSAYGENLFDKSAAFNDMGVSINDQLEFSPGMIKRINDMPRRLGMSEENYKNKVTRFMPVIAQFETSNDYD